MGVCLSWASDCGRSVWRLRDATQLLWSCLSVGSWYSLAYGIIVWGLQSVTQFLWAEFVTHEKLLYVSGFNLFWKVIRLHKFSLRTVSGTTLCLIKETKNKYWPLSVLDFLTQILASWCFTAKASGREAARADSLWEPVYEGCQSKYRSV